MKEGEKMDRNYEKSFFDYAAYTRVMEKASKNPDDLDVIKECMDAFFEYVRIVDSTEVAIKSAYFRLEGYDLRQAAHKVAIVFAKVINRMAAIYDESNIFTGNCEEKLEVADFCLDVTVNVFEDRRK